jgi:CubicO group peptidase (beta-lactamase class C family)
MDLRESNPGLTRRRWLGGAVAIGAAGALPALPAWAQEPATWPAVRTDGGELCRRAQGREHGRALGRGQAEPEVIAAGVDGFTGARKSDADSIYRIYSMTKPITGWRR